MQETLEFPKGILILSRFFILFNFISKSISSFSSKSIKFTILLANSSSNNEGILLLLLLTSILCGDLLCVLAILITELSSNFFLEILLGDLIDIRLTGVSILLF